MKKNIAKKWTDALRSGEYKQGHGFLCQRAENNAPAFCCLGVLCDLYAQEHPEAGWRHAPRHSDSTPFYCDAAHVNDIEDEVLPECVQEWAGVETCAGRLCITVEETVQAAKYAGYSPDEMPSSLSLAVLNDNSATFDKIADLIDKHWRKL